MAMELKSNLPSGYVPGCWAGKTTIHGRIKRSVLPKFLYNSCFFS
jgi:hypothetical protein